jgi:predicted glycoside hydrolase/deacetylase ChbG (UPF0249 family)
VTSLLGPQGYFWPEAGLVASHARPEEVECELRAQIDMAMRMGILPTHLDSHMGTLFQNRQLFSVYVKVAHEYHLPFLAVRVNDEGKEWISLLSPGDILLDSVIMFSPGVSPEPWTESYVKVLQGLEPGLRELIVHLGHDDSELEAISLDHPDYGAAWRERDLRAVTSPQFKKALGKNHIIRLGWKDLKKLVL